MIPIKNKIASFCLILAFIVQREVDSIEVNYTILGLVTIFLLGFNRGKMFKKDFELISILIAIVILGIVVSIFAQPTIYNFVRDLTYFTKPILLILLGYFAARAINDWKILFKVIIYLGVGYAIYHILHTLIYTDFTTATASSIRGVNGLSNILEIFAIAILILSFKYPIFDIIKRHRTRNIFLLLLLVSFVLYFSRTMFVAIFFLILGVLNYLKINKKGLRYSMVFLILFGGFYAYLYSIDLDRKGNGLESFLYKMKIAPFEIFSPKIDLTNLAELWDHWRAYEAYSALQHLNAEPVTYVYGNGLGALVDLKFAAPISSEGTVRFIPILHNGYIFILFKTGVIGLFLYLIFLFSLYLQSYTRKTTPEHQVFSNLVASTALYLLFSSLIITGIYNVDEITPIVLGSFLYLNTYVSIKKEIVHEDRNYRG